MKPTRVSILPNTTNAYVLRVYRTDIERLPIIAWRIEEYDNPYQVWTAPVSIEEAASNSVEFIVVDDGKCYLLDNTRIDDEDSAIIHARTVHDEKLK